MPYTDPTTVRVALSPGGDDADQGSAASLPADDLLAKIADATDEVNAKLSGRYSTPFADPAPDMVKAITTAIAAYLATLTARRGDPLLPGDPVLLTYQRATGLLTQLQNGQATLNGTTVPPPSDVSAPVVINPVDGDLFTPSDFPIRPAAPFGWPDWSLTGP